MCTVLPRKEIFKYLILSEGGNQVQEEHKKDQIAFAMLCA